MWGGHQNFNDPIFSGLDLSKTKFGLSCCFFNTLYNAKPANLLQMNILQSDHAQPMNHLSLRHSV